MSGLILEVRAYRLPLRQPFATSAGAITHRSGYLVRVRDSAGVAGYGDAAPLAGFGGGSPDRTEAALALLGRHLQELGAVDDVIGCPAELRQLATSLESVSLHPAAVAGVTFALADLSARRAGSCLAKWLHPEAAESIAVNATIGALSETKAAAAACQAAQDGYDTVKVKVGTTLEEDVARVAAVRRVLAPSCRLRLDANGAWTLGQAREVLPRLEEFGIEYVEQPTPADDIEALAVLRREQSVPIAADEALLQPGGATRVLAAEAADLLVLKPSLLGGPWRSESIADLARESDVGVVVTSALESAIGRLGALHLAAALSSNGQDHAFGLATGELFTTDVAPWIQAQGGRLSLDAVADARALAAELDTGDEVAAGGTVGRGDQPRESSDQPTSGTHRPAEAEPASSCLGIGAIPAGLFQLPCGSEA